MEPISMQPTRTQKMYSPKLTGFLLISCAVWSHAATDQATGTASLTPNFYSETQTTGSCGSEWESKYGCKKAQISCQKITYPISKLGQALSVGDQSICTDGENFDTIFKYQVIDVGSGKQVALDDLFKEDELSQLLFQNVQFREKFKLTSAPANLFDFMSNIPEVENFDFSRFMIRSVIGQQIELDFFVVGNWEVRGQQQDFLIKAPMTAIATKYHSSFLHFGQYSSYIKALKLFKKHDLVGCANMANNYLQNSDLATENLSAYNDAGFFLEQANRPTEAIPILEKVIAFDPSRTPAYLNLADAYAKAGDKAKAKEKYQKYMELMEQTGKGSKVPARVHEFLKN